MFNPLAATLLLLVTSPTPDGSKPVEPSPKVLRVALSQRVTLSPGDTVEVDGTGFFAKYVGLVERTPCATPTNCGAAYQPPTPSFETPTCPLSAKCPYQIEVVGNGYGPECTIKVQSRASCLADPQARDDEKRRCFQRFLQGTRSAAGCDAVEAGMGRDSCLELFVQARDASTPAFCRKFSPQAGRARDACFRRAGMAATDVTLCNEISAENANDRSQCYSAVGIAKRDIRLCERIAAEQVLLKSACVAAAIKNGPSAYRRPGFCRSIADLVTRDFCLANTIAFRPGTSACDGISDANLQARKECWGNQAQLENDERLCDKLTGSAYRSRCCAGIRNSDGTTGCKTVKP